MNKYLTFAGTQPVYLGDIDFMQNAVGAALTQFARGLMNSGSDTLNAILQGVEQTVENDVVTISPGIVILNGEILPFEGTSLASGSTLYFHVQSTLSGERTFKNGESHDCYETRKAIINTTASDGIAVNSVPILHDDRAYIGSSGGGLFVGGSLRKKNGLWFAGFSVNASTVLSDPESVLLFNVSLTHYNQIDEIAFPQQIVLYDGANSVIYNGIFHIYKFSPNTVALSISFPSGTTIQPGEETCEIWIPII